MNTFSESHLFFPLSCPWSMSAPTLGRTTRRQRLTFLCENLHLVSITLGQCKVSSSEGLFLYPTSAYSLRLHLFFRLNSRTWEAVCKYMQRKVDIVAEILCEVLTDFSRNANSDRKSVV